MDASVASWQQARRYELASRQRTSATHSSDPREPAFSRSASYPAPPGTRLLLTFSSLCSAGPHLSLSTSRSFRIPDWPFRGEISAGGLNPPKKEPAGGRYLA